MIFSSAGSVPTPRQEIVENDPKMTSRAVICHYHLFKNSGTSFDRVLTENFGAQHIIFDGPFSYSHVDQDQLGIIIERNPEAKAFSSHQISLPTPSSVRYRVIPAVFVRHPLLRIRSVYLFSQQAGATGAVADALRDFDQWLLTMFSGDNNTLQLSNFQTNMLSRENNAQPVAETRQGQVVYDLQRAIDRLSVIPCLGRTEHFDTDVFHFSNTLGEYGIEFTHTPGTAENVSSPDFRETTAVQLANLESSIDGSTMQKLMQMNRQDLELYNVTTEMVEKRLRRELCVPVAQNI